MRVNLYGRIEERIRYCVEMWVMATLFAPHPSRQAKLPYTQDNPKEVKPL